jgi:hypothetical protein
MLNPIKSRVVPSQMRIVLSFITALAGLSVMKCGGEDPISRSISASVSRGVGTRVDLVSPIRARSMPYTSPSLAPATANSRPPCVRMIAGAALMFEGTYVQTPGLFANYDVSGDGQRFLMVKPIESQTSDVTQINVVLNWFEELKQRVPVH